MKKIIVLLGFLMMVGICQAQVRFFKPVPKDLFKSGTLLKAGETINPTSVWIIRPAVELSAVQLTWNKTTKEFDSQAFSSTGLGVGFQHYVQVNGEPYNNFGFNALLLFVANMTEQTASMALVGTVTALKFVNVGAGYNFGTKTVLILTGITYNF
jgi:hypothetical protein